MATWHQLRAQRRNPVRLDHPTEWTVVSDPPNGLRTCMSFTTEEAARAYFLRHNGVAFILPPRPN